MAGERLHSKSDRKWVRLALDSAGVDSFPVEKKTLNWSLDFEGFDWPCPTDVCLLIR
jgi:hypothetical protein